MRAILIFIITLLSLQVNGMSKDSIQVIMASDIKQPTIQEVTNQKVTSSHLIHNTRFKNFNVSTDWLLETKAELINGVSYSPTLEFNLSRPNGFNFQVQTGALPILEGLKIQKTQPAAGLSFSYKF